MSGTVAVLARLRYAFPAWVIWHGEHTGEYWAVPKARRQMILINAATPEELAAKLRPFHPAHPADQPPRPTPAPAMAAHHPAAERRPRLSRPKFRPPQNRRTHRARHLART